MSWSVEIKLEKLNESDERAIGICLYHDVFIQSLDKFNFSNA